LKFWYRKNKNDIAQLKFSYLCSEHFVSFHYHIVMIREHNRLYRQIGSLVSSNDFNESFFFQWVMPARCYTIYHWIFLHVIQPWIIVDNYSVPVESATSANVIVARCRSKYAGTRSLWHRLSYLGEEKWLMCNEAFTTGGM